MSVKHDDIFVPGSAKFPWQMDVQNNVHQVLINMIAKGVLQRCLHFAIKRFT